MEQKEQNTAVASKEITARILEKVNAFTATGELKLPTDYSPENALKGAMLMLDDMKALEKYSHSSIAQALLRMVVEGLSPIKGQGYFIPYGKDLNWSRSYQGSIALARRVGDVDRVTANVIYENDVFNYQINPETGLKRIINHDQKLENIDNAKIKGAYAVVIYNDGTTSLEVMTMAEIRQAWEQGATKGNSPAHKNFGQEMCRKTVINRACKGPINSSSDATLFTSNDEDENGNRFDHFEEVKDTIETKTGKKAVNFQAEDVEPEAPEVSKVTKKDTSKAPIVDKNGQSTFETEGPEY